MATKANLNSLDFSKLKNEYPALICSVLIVAIAFFAFRNVFNPLLGRIKKASQQIEQIQGNTQKARISPEELSKLESQIEALKSQIDYYHQKLKVKADVPQILKELNQIGERLNIKFVSVNPLEIENIPLPEAEESLIRMPLKIRLQCGYHELGLFINQIENLPRFIKITDLKLSTDSKNIWVHQAEVVVTSYSLVSSKVESRE